MESNAAPATKTLTVALLGNPNCGKSSLFNQLTGLRQKVGNFPGVTVEKKTGKAQLNPNLEIHLIDFPGTYSLYPNSQDERIVVQTLLNPKDHNYPDLVLYVADVTRLEKHFLLFTQLRDLGIPLLLVLNMGDLAQKGGYQINTKALSDRFEVPVVTVSGRTGEGLPELREAIAGLISQLDRPKEPARFYRLTAAEKALAAAVREKTHSANEYQTLLLAHHHAWLPFLTDAQRAAIRTITESKDLQSLRLQVNETMRRFDDFTPVLQQNVRRPSADANPLTTKLDNILTNPIVGPLIFLGIMLLVFQAIFAWASYPMDWIESIFGQLGDSVRAVLPESWFTDLITDGILAGLGGIVVFVPQIAILFFLITLLEEVGYMARAAFLFDRIMQFFGLNGRSMVALISSSACAIPAIMSARTIGNWKERLITIMVTPLISCSARIPVYTVLIGFVVPATTVGGFFNLQGLAFMGLYLLGIIAALLSALAFKFILKSDERSFLMLELPEYRLPVMRNVGLTVWEKVKSFLLEAGKVIFVISIVLWGLANFGPTQAMQDAEAQAIETAATQNLNETETANLLASNKIEASFAGHLGKFIEPAIRPLGFDWKIGIALLTSFAAREVFVGTMATIYSIGSSDDEFSVRDRMANELDPATGKPVYTLATSLSLLIFYVFAMMCMSTLAVVRRETNSWKWPLIQFFFMTGLAYLGSFLVYQWLG